MLKVSNGYILLDILLGVFILGLGFLVMWSLNNSAVLESGRLDTSLKAINLASSTLDELHCKIEENKDYIDSFTSVEVKDRYGLFDREIKAEWKSADLVLLKVKIQWLERGVIKDYNLESFYYAQ